MQTIDALGKACPMPVLLAKKAMDGGESSLSILVDNTMAVENLKKLAASQGYAATVAGEGERYTVTLVRSGEALPTPPETAAPAAPTGNWALFVGREGIGTGGEELGKNLMRMFFYTLTQGENLPKWILFMNGGVKLPAGDAQIVEHLRALIARGCGVQVCGTCLSFFSLGEALQVGQVSNMYDIQTAMLAADKVITL